MVRFDKFASVWRALPSRLKNALFQLRYGAAIDPQGGLGRLPILLHHPFQDPYFAELEKDNGRLVIRLNREYLFSHREVFDVFWKRLTIMVAFFTATGPQVRHAKVEISDIGDIGDTGQPVMCFCSKNPNAALIPDVNFLRKDAYHPFRRLAASNFGNWDDRRPVVLWRGAGSDPGSWSGELDAGNMELKYRIRMAILLRDTAGVDAKIYRIPAAPRAAMARMWEHGLAGKFIPQANWIGYKFAIDIDGVSNAWGNLFIRLLLGCCVLKIASVRGFHQWYYDELEPWKHYVPVHGDMSDLREKIAWCFAHDRQCREIAEAGQRLVLNRSVAGETARTIERLNVLLADGRAHFRPDAPGSGAST